MSVVKIIILGKNLIVESNKEVSYINYECNNRWDYIQRIINTCIKEKYLELLEYHQDFFVFQIQELLNTKRATLEISDDYILTYYSHKIYLDILKNYLKYLEKSNVKVLDKNVIDETETTLDKSEELQELNLIQMLLELKEQFPSSILNNLKINKKEIIFKSNEGIDKFNSKFSKIESLNIIFMNFILSISPNEHNIINQIDKIIGPDYSLIIPKKGDLLNREIHHEKLIELPGMSGKITKVNALGLKHLKKIMFKADVEASV